MKRKQKQNVALAIIGVIIIGIAILYSYSTEQAKVRGYNFGNNLKSLQDDLKTLQSNFESRIIMWKEGSISTYEILEYSDEHVKEMEKIITRYDELSIPDSFTSAVDLFKLSTQAQLESDMLLIEWIETGDENASIRSNVLLQESFEYEMAALSKYNSVKSGNNP